MGRAVRQSQEMRQRMRQKMGAKLIAAGAILEMSSVELQLRVREEIATNPALEIVDEQLCPVCREPVRDGTCPNCGFTRPERYTPEALALAYDDRPLTRQPADWRAEEEDYDPFARVEHPVSLQDHLRLQVRTVIQHEDLPLAEYLIANINDKGLIECGLEEAAGALGTTLERVENTLAAIQTLDPPGVGSRTSQQALLVQLIQLEERGVRDPFARAIIESHWQDLADHTYSRIAKALKVSSDAVQGSVEFIRHNLDPYPGRHFRVSWDNQPGNSQAIQRPDAVIRRQGADYAVEVADHPDFALRVSEAYRRLHRRLLREGRPWQDVEWQQALDHLRRADWFIQSIYMRRRTLQAVTEAIVEHQTPFLDTGQQERLQPLTRARLAQILDKHESTISRATANKFVLLPSPSNRVIPYDFFFMPSLSAKSIIENVVRRESPTAPLTDAQIRQILTTRGFSLARRTVAKYRLALHIPSSAQRGAR